MGSGDYNPLHIPSQAECQTHNRKNHHPLPDQTVIIVIIRILLSLYGEIYGQEEEISFNSFEKRDTKYAMGNYHTYFQYLVPSFQWSSFRFRFIPFIHSFRFQSIDHIEFFHSI